jgi:hypothetical protein
MSITLGEAEKTARIDKADPIHAKMAVTVVSQPYGQDKCNSGSKR